MDRMNGAARACIAILLAISLTACATSMGSTFDEGVATDIKAGETTKAQIIERLGQPALVHGSVAEEVWTYAYYRGPGFSFFQREVQNRGTQKRLVVKFKGENVTESQFIQEIPSPNWANR
jgi:outer membrane protein assembly factor BamE (lipoprotein component of BamABCDE complex)